MVYNGAMSTSKQVRRSVTLPAPVAKQVESIANRRRLSDNRVLVELIEMGIEASKQKEKDFFELRNASAHPKTPTKRSNWETNWAASSLVGSAADRNLAAASRRNS